MINGYIIKYKPKDAKARTLLNNTLVGRLNCKAYRGNKSYYYREGELDNIKFCRIHNGKIFVTSLDFNTEVLNCFGEITIEPAERPKNSLILKTGREYWKDHAKERGMVFRDKRTKKKQRKCIKNN